MCVIAVRLGLSRQSCSQLGNWQLALMQRCPVCREHGGPAPLKFFHYLFSFCSASFFFFYSLSFRAPIPASSLPHFASIFVSLSSSSSPYLLFFAYDLRGPQSADCRGNTDGSCTIPMHHFFLEISNLKSDRWL